LKAQAERQQQVLKAQAIAESAEIIAQRMTANPEAKKAIEILLALGYIDMGSIIGKSDSSKVMFMDPRTIPATLEGIRSIVSDSDSESKSLFPKN
jgi:regulator of protease activity HflC (stomatin/prohibitin superfamily)